MEAIALVGIGCRFPAAPDVRSYWKLLVEGRDAISVVPRDRYDVDALYNPRAGTAGKLITRHGGFIDDVDHFDATFFGIAPREAARMDPQHRLLLEVAWEAMEDAGQRPEQLTGTTAGVFIGIITSDYWDRQFRNPALLDVYSTTGSARSGAAGRISYALGLQGISVALDAACSSSLVAVHLACQSLRSGSCTMALAGGVNLILNPDHTIGYSQAGMMARDGHCKAFDARADGYVRSEGAGVIVLKPLSRALSDGDRIYAVIRGSAVNNDGHSDFFMTPSVPGQQAVLRQAYRDAGIDPVQVGYVEAHGTGTAAGDPVELTALGSVLGERRPADQPFFVGSAKTNIGHTEGAAGLAGIIKTALCLYHKTIPPNLHFETPNPAIPWDTLPLTVPQSLQPFPAIDGMRIAGVSSFGIAGTNAHVVLQEAPEQPVRPYEESGMYLLPLSAHTPTALREQARRYSGMWNTMQPPALFDSCYTASMRRTHHEHRLALVCRSSQEAASLLDQFSRQDASTSIAAGRVLPGQRHKMAWIFPGQGAQWVGMGRQLLLQEPVFRMLIEQCDRLMKSHVEWSLLKLLQCGTAADLEQIDRVQPMLFALQVALAALWRSWGIHPDVVVGHSMGEVAAAYVAGSLSLEDACKIICERSKLLRRTSGQGAMAVVELSREQAEVVVRDYAATVSVAVCNSPTSTVLSGDPQALAAILSMLEKHGVFGRLVKVNVASHSPQMDILRDDLLTVLSGLRPGAATIPICSTVTGFLSTGQDFTASYWVKNLRAPVLYLDAIQQVIEEGCTQFIEMSAHPTLVGATRQILQSSGVEGIVLGSLLREEDERHALLQTLAALYVTGAEIHWQALYPDGGSVVSLPTYAWQKERYWYTPDDTAVPVMGHSWSSGGHPLIGTALQPALEPGMRYWEQTLDVKQLSYLTDHQVYGMVILPGVAYLEMALAAAHDVYADQSIYISDVTVKKPLFFAPGQTHTVQLVFSPTTSTQALLQGFYREQGTGDGQERWKALFEAKLSCSSDVHIVSSAVAVPQVLHEPGWQALDHKVHYQRLRARGIEHGSLFQGAAQLWQRGQEVVAKIVVPQEISFDLARYQVHPALFDACVQAIMPLLPEGTDQDTYVPVHVGRVILFHQPTGSGLWSYAVLRDQAEDTIDVVEGDIVLLDEQQRVVLRVEGFRLQRLDRAAYEDPAERLSSFLYAVHWEPVSCHLPTTLTMAGKHWLIFADQQQRLGAVLAARLTYLGARVTLVEQGGAYTQLSPAHFVVPQSSFTDLKQALTDLLPHHRDGLNGILYLPGMNIVAHDNGLLLQQEQELACGSLLSLLQVMTAIHWQSVPRLWIVTRNAHAIVSTDTVQGFAQAPLWGLGRVMMYEHPDPGCTLLDIAQSCPEEAADRVVKELLLQRQDDAVAWRGEQRYVARLVHHAGMSRQMHTSTLFKSQGTYLISGGLGGVGLRVAQWMVEQGAHHLVLVGRRPPTVEAEQTLNVLRATGAQVYVIRADVAEERQVAALLAEIQHTMPPLCGIFHAAVVLDDSTLLQLKPDRFTAVMRPKIAGAWNLHRLTANLPLDYFVLFSSAASLIGSPGQGNYAAANAFMDALAHYRHKMGLPALSINWGRWGEVGQATVGDREARLDARGFAAMRPEDGLALLGTLLREPQPQVGVMSFDRQQWCAFFPVMEQSSFFAQLKAEEETSQGQREQPGAVHLDRTVLQSLENEQRLPVLGNYLGQQIARVLGLSTPAIDRYQQVNRLGIDSLMAVELKNRVQADLQVQVPVATFLQGITLEQLSARVLQSLSATGS